MNKEQVYGYMAAILQTLDAVKDGGPESMLYMAIGCSLDDWQMINSLLVRNGFIKNTGHWCTITEKGSATAKKLNEAMVSAPKSDVNVASQVKESNGRNG